MDLTKSIALFERSKKLVPAGVHSPVRAFRSVGGTPIFFVRGEKTQLFDVDGNSYLDFCMSWGALSLGHAYPSVVEAIQKQASLGTHYGTPTPHDVELAELVLSALKPYDEIRFVNSGTEAVMTAIRLARGCTGRDKIVKIDGAYHGHVDSLLVAAGSGLVTSGLSDSAGVTKGMVDDTLVIPPGQTEALEQVFAQYGSQIAAVIVEPVMANNGLFEYSPEYFQLLRSITRKNGALLIFDEVITGFRVAWGGAAARYGIDPDIGTYGKIIGGGMPVGAIAAKKEIMEALAPIGKVYQAGTLSGNPLAMVAGLAQLKGMQKENFYEKVETLGKYLDAKVAALKASRPDRPFGFRRVAGIFWFCLGQNETPLWPQQIPTTAKGLYAESFHALLEKGIYTAPSAYEVGFLSSAHTTADVDRLTEALATL